MNFLINFIFTFTLIFSVSLKAESNSNCIEIQEKISISKKEIEDKIKKGFDINDQLDILKKFISENDRCIVNSNHDNISSYENYIRNPNRKFNLNEKECTPYGVDTTNMPNNRTQGDLGWCFAFSTADLLSFYEKKKFSAYDIAINNHLMKFKDNLEDNEDYSDVGGHASEAIEYAISNSKGVCLEDEVAKTTKDWDKVSEIIQKIVAKDSNILELYCKEEMHLLKIVDTLSVDVIKALANLSEVKRMQVLLDMSCKNRQKISTKLKPHYQEFELSNEAEKQQAISIVDSLLEKGEPISVGYTSSVLKNGVNFIGEPDHLSTAIGRKFNKETGDCEYLIRNSWGNDHSCSSTKTIRCEDGNYWVPRTTLMNNLDELSWITKE